jgi:Rieske Fe-S protein
VTREPALDMRPTRRGMLTGAGAACLAGTLAACGQAGGTAASATTSWKKSSGSETSPASTRSGSAGSGSAGSGETELANVSAIPEGGGMVITSAKVVVTQPASGDYKAFTAICTHEQCLVDQVADGTINCPCHGSKFSVTDGAVVNGPATEPLAEKTIKVSSGKIYLA